MKQILKQKQKRNITFSNLLGNSPKIRIIEFLIEGRELDYSLTDIAKNSKVSWTTLNRIWKELEEAKLVIHTRNIGKAKLYKINEKNKIIQHLIELYDSIIKYKLKI